MAARAAPLRTMRLVDAGGAERRVRETAEFASREIMDRPFGWNVPNAAVRAALTARLDALPAARLVAGRKVTGLLARSAHALARLSDGAQVRARLVVAADGRDSAVREMAGIRAHRWHYGQKALVFAVTHPEPHGGVSTEIHRSGGPLTLVPMPDHAGRPSSSVVWMTPGPRAHRLHALADSAFAAELLEDWDAELEHFTRVMPDAYAEVIADRERDDVRTELPGSAEPRAGTAGGVEVGATDD
jgi:2-octaprenyl-6-methoxyphenol hydroxylase